MLKVLKLRDVFGSPKPSKNSFLKVLVKVFGEGFFLRDNLKKNFARYLAVTFELSKSVKA